MKLLSFNMFVKKCSDICAKTLEYVQ